MIRHGHIEWRFDHVPSQQPLEADERNPSEHRARWKIDQVALPGEETEQGAQKAANIHVLENPNVLADSQSSVSKRKKARPSILSAARNQEVQRHVFSYDPVDLARPSVIERRQHRAAGARGIVPALLVASSSVHPGARL